MKKKINRITLRYGENPNQGAWLINQNKKSIFDFQISGKKIGYNNIIDLDNGLRCLKEFNEPTSIIIKHTNACGVASARNIYNAFIKSYESDNKSAFGGVILLNKKVDVKLADRINKHFFELVAAPDYEKIALNILKRKKNLIIIKLPIIKKNLLDYKSTLFGDLYQKNDLLVINKTFIKLASIKKAKRKELNDLIFSLKIVKHLKSNAIVLTKDKQTIGLGSGQTNRIDALKSAIKNKKLYFGNKSFVCASDGFFPFTDSISLLNKNKCKVIAQPSGSISDFKVINYAIKQKISLYFIKNRLFKH
tara:strand:+ start:446 stop:1363 length:918 start_codon:yes stop_codon:yes gene_type:complete